jgi:hypothetical protein
LAFSTVSLYAHSPYNFFEFWLPHLHTLGSYLRLICSHPISNVAHLTLGLFSLWTNGMMRTIKLCIDN